MKVEEFEGKNVDQAIEEACKFFNVTPDELDIEIVTHGSTGLFGIGAKKARIKARVKEEALLSKRAAEAEKVLEELVSATGFEINFKVRVENEKIHVDLSGRDRELLTSRGGTPLNALQYLVNKIVARRLGLGPKIVLDIAGFRQEQEQRISQMAQRAAERAQKTGRPVELRPMPPHERRLVHLCLKNFNGIETRSKGQGKNRRVVIYPKKVRANRRR